MPAVPRRLDVPPRPSLPSAGELRREHLASMSCHAPVRPSFSASTWPPRRLHVHALPHTMSESSGASHLHSLPLPSAGELWRETPSRPSSPCVGRLQREPP